MSRNKSDSSKNRLIIAAFIATTVAVVTASLVPGLFYPGTATISAGNNDISWAASGRIAGFMLVFFSIVFAILQFADRIERK